MGADGLRHDLAASVREALADKIEWRAVDRLPNEGAISLVTHGRRRVLGVFKDGEWKGERGKALTFVPTHWMALALPEKTKQTRKPAMPAEQKNRARAGGPVAKAHDARYAAPWLDIGKTETGWSIENFYRSSDEAEWQRLLGEAFGSRTKSVIGIFIGQVVSLVPHIVDPEAGKSLPREEDLQVALSIVAAMKPRNEAEAAQAAQVFAHHVLTMKLGAQQAQRSYVDPQTVNALANLVKAYSGVMDSMRKRRGSGTKKQVIKLQKHVRVYNDNRSVSPGGGGIPAEIYAMQRVQIRAREWSAAIANATTPEPDSLSKARRCSARRKSGEPCRGKAMRGRNTCRMHGGGRRTGPRVKRIAIIGKETT